MFYYCFRWATHAHDRFTKNESHWTQTQSFHRRPLWVLPTAAPWRSHPSSTFYCPAVFSRKKKKFSMKREKKISFRDSCHSSRSGFHFFLGFSRKKKMEILLQPTTMAAAAVGNQKEMFLLCLHTDILLKAISWSENANKNLMRHVYCVQRSFPLFVTLPSIRIDFRWNSSFTSCLTRHPSAHRQIQSNSTELISLILLKWQFCSSVAAFSLEAHYKDGDDIDWFPIERFEWAGPKSIGLVTG